MNALTPETDRRKADLRQVGEAVATAARLLGRQVSADYLLAKALPKPQMGTLRIVQILAAACGLEVRAAKIDVSRLTGQGPVLVKTDDGSVRLIMSLVAGRAWMRTWQPGRVPVDQEIDPVSVGALLTGAVLVLSAGKDQPNLRMADVSQRRGLNWYTQTVVAARGPMLSLAMASFVSSLLAIGVSLFSMQVYDRVIPARSMPTLTVLTMGVISVLLLDFALRVVRGAVTDHFGKRADLKMSRMIFSQMLDLKADARPRSAGSLVSQLRDMEQLREFLTSTNLGVLFDLPFSLVFLGVIWALGGAMALIPLAAIPLIVLPGLVLQIPLSRLSTAGNEEGALRNSILMESVNRIDDIKSMQAEPRFVGEWLAASRTLGLIGMRQKILRTGLLSWSQFVQQLAYVGVIAMGAFGIIEGTLSFGALIACSTLTSRTIAPLGQLAGVLGTLQNARVSKTGLDRLMDLPTDHGQSPGESTGWLHRPILNGEYRIDNLTYHYDPKGPASLVIPHLSVEAGERVGIIGRAGAGKSTFLRLLAGLAEPTSGRILMDGSDMGAIDRADIRRNCGALMQGFDLFYGSIRDNLLAASPFASDEDLLAAMRLTSADELLRHNSKGLDQRVYENGIGLSGGQRQALLLTRVLLRNPPILVLDEPTASMDEMTERRIITNLKEVAKGRTLFLSTHRYQLLDIVDRLIVLDGGRIMADGPKAEVIERLRTPAPQPAQIKGQP